MRYPVDDWEKYYIAQGYGEKTSYGYHEGVDLNLRTGGDTDLGQPLFAIADGEVTSIHNHTTSFGNHFHVKHDGPWGTCYSHYAHCQNIFVKLNDLVKMDDKVATLGKSGKSDFAHLHFAIKKRPTGVDSVPKTLELLYDGWENPVEFIETWRKQIMFNDQTKIPIGGDFGEMELQAVRSTLTDQKREISGLRNDLDNAVIRVNQLEEQIKEEVVTFSHPIAKWLFGLAWLFEARDKPPG